MEKQDSPGSQRKASFVRPWSIVAALLIVSLVIGSWVVVSQMARQQPSPAGGRAAVPNEPPKDVYTAYKDVVYKLSGRDGSVITLHNLAELYRRQGKYEQAEELYQRALAIREKVLGSDHPDTATTLHNLAYLYQDQGKYEQAEALYQRALAIYEQAFDPDHPYIANTLENYACLLRQMQRNEEAANA